MMSLLTGGNKSCFLKRRHRVVLFLLLASSIGIYSQTTIRGKIVDEGGTPVAGATIQVKSVSTEGTVADIDGNFTLSTGQRLPVTLVASFLGFIPQEVLVRDGRSPLNLILKENIETLDEVVVTAGGLFRARREQGYATIKITDEELIAGKSPTLAAGLTAKIPGLQVNAISSGVNPNYRLVLRGNRSINGNNQALIVVDNAIVSNEFLNNVNPNDIDNIQVLNGASGSALYGSEASNGVLLITTKAGQKGKAQIKVSNTTTAESVSFFPKLQSRFGQGATAFTQEFDPVENQQYGPAFDGSMRNLGYPLADGSQLQIPYAPAENGRNSFWETGIQNQSDISFSYGNDNITSYVSAQYFTATGTTPGDKYDRIMIRFNNTQKLTNSLNLSYSASYTENNYDITNYTSGIYDRLNQISANVPVTDFKDWRNNKYATPEGWYNPWYHNPYWVADNYRADRKDTYLTGKAELKWNILPWLHVLYRASLANRYYQTHEHSPGIQFSNYAISEQGKSNLSGFVLDIQRNRYRLNQDAQIGMNKTFNDFSVNATLGWSYFNDNRKSMTYEATGLLIPDLFNISNRLNDVNIPRADTEYPSSGTGIRSGDIPNHIVRQRNYGIWLDAVFGYKNYLFLHLSGRDDQTSLLAPENREYFYPAADLSFIATDAVGALREHDMLDYLKLRAGWSKVGNVNIDPYDITPVYNSTVGFSTGTYFRKGSKLVLDLKPEITTGWEIGTEFRLLKNLAEVQFTYYHSSTTGQTIEASIARSTGANSMLINTGEVTNDGVETSLRLNPIRTKDLNVSVGANYTHNKNKLVSLYPGLDALGVNGSTVVYAIQGYEINQIYVPDYNRVPAFKDWQEDNPRIPNDPALVGKVIVDPLTGYPSRAASPAIMGNTSPRDRIGLDLSIRWKDFTLSSVFEYRGGYYAVNTSMASGLDFSGASARSAYYNRERFVFPSSVIRTGTDADGYPVYADNTDRTISDVYTFWTNSTYNRGTYSNYVYSGNYWKWRELAISYSVPKTFVSNLTAGFVQDITVSAQGRNLLLWLPASNEYTDPDFSANDNNAVGVTTLAASPPTRYFGGTVSFTF